MDAELQKKLVDYLGTLEEAVKTGSDFVAEQAPLVVQEYLGWCFWEAVVWVVVAGAGCCVLLSIIGIVWHASKDFRFCDDDEFPMWMTRGTSVVIVLLLCVPVVGKCLIPNALTALQITIAPRVFLLERIAELVK